jgi:predicted ester cyclase
LVVEGSFLAAHLRDSGTHTGSWLGVAPTGRRVTTQEFALYRFEDGSIAQVWARADDLSVLRQLRD